MLHEDEDHLLDPVGVPRHAFRAEAWHMQFDLHTFALSGGLCDGDDVLQQRLQGEWGNLQRDFALKADEIQDSIGVVGDLVTEAGRDGAWDSSARSVRCEGPTARAVKNAKAPPTVLTAVLSATQRNICWAQIPLDLLNRPGETRRSVTLYSTEKVPPVGLCVASISRFHSKKNWAYGCAPSVASGYES